MDINSRINTLMRDNGWDNPFLARNAGMSPNTVKSITKGISGNPTIENLGKIADGLGISMSQLFNEDDTRYAATNEQSEFLALMSRQSPEHQTAITLFLKMICMANTRK